MIPRLLPAAVLLVPRAARACAVCFGALDGTGLSRGIWWAIVLLLAVTLSLIGGIGWAFWSIERARQARDG